MTITLKHMHTQWLYLSGALHAAVQTATLQLSGYVITAQQPLASVPRVI
jgi:hypothetical protein